MAYRLARRIGILATGLVPFAAQAEPPKDPSGAWLTEDGRARIRIEKCGPVRDQLCGYVVWLKAEDGENAQARRDANNPDRAKAARPLLGHQLILGARPNDEGQYDGRIYNAENGKSYDVTIWLRKPNDLRVKGCLVAPLCSTQSWTRTTDLAPGQLAGATGAPGGPQPDPEWAVKAPSVTSSTAAARREPKPRP